jgi:REP element-mobilizing transposase RayT
MNFSYNSPLLHLLYCCMCCLRRCLSPSAFPAPRTPASMGWRLQEGGKKGGQGAKIDKILDGLTRFSRPDPWALSSLVPSIMPLLGGNRRGTLFNDEHDHKFFLHALSQVCERTDWLVHAWVLMGKHYHLFIQTPKPNLVDGMKWLQNTLKLVKCVMPEKKSRAGRSSLERITSHKQKRWAQRRTTC